MISECLRLLVEFMKLWWVGLLYENARVPKDCNDLK